MSLVSELTALKNKENTLRGNNAVTPFAYDSEAYNADDADGHADYVSNRHNNIPLADNAVIELNPFVTNKGLRKQASSFTRQLINHFCGRSSYNLNKTTDVVHGALDKLASYVGQPDGLAILDANGRIPSAQLPEDAVEYKGSWNAQTNSPHLVNGTGNKGDMYFVSQSGQQNLWDKLSWKLQLNSSQLRNNFIAMCYGNGTWLALENNSTLRYSTNDFKSISGGLFENNITDVCFYRGKYFYTKSSNAGSVIYYATDLAEAFPWASASNVPIHSLYCIRGDGNTLIAGGTEGIIKSSDEGNSWTVVSNVSVKKIAGYNGTWVACKTGGGLLISSDDGETWTDIGGATSGLIFVSIFANNGKWLASTEGQGVWESSGAETWTVISYIPEKAVCINVYSYDNIWVISSTGGVDETVTFKGIYVSYNNAVTWSEERLSNTKGVTVTCSREGIWLCSLEAVGSSDNIVIYRADFYPVTFLEGDEVVYNGSVWERIPVGALNTVNGVAPVSGNVEITGKDLAYSKQYINTKSLAILGSFNSSSLYYANGIYFSNKYYSENGKVWKVNTNNLDLGMVIYFNNLWIACSSNYIYWSEDGKSWTKGNTRIPANFVASNSNICVAPHDSKGLWWTEDGKTWTKGTGLPNNVGFITVCYANGIWVAGSSSRGLWWSTDGKTWTQGTGVTTYIGSLIVNLNGLWIAYIYSHGFWWSEDGKDWTQATGMGANIDLYSEMTIPNKIYYANGLWVSSTSNKGTLWSEDGKDWSQGTGIPKGTTIMSVYYANNKWLALALYGKLWVSSDGKNWTQDQQLAGSSYLAGYNNLIFLGTEGKGIFWSLLGDTWERGTEEITFISLWFANNIWVAGSENKGLWWSTDGENWTQGSGETTSSIFYVCYANNLWVACNSYNKLLWSNNGKAWSQATHVPSSSMAYRQIIYAENIWVAVGSGTIWSTDGKYWERGGVGQAYSVSRVFYTNSVWIGVGNNYIYKSTDGKNFAQVYQCYPETCTCVYCANNLWLVGTTGGLYYSEDNGANWQVLTDTINYTFYDICYANNIWVACTNNGLLWSIDGKIWNQIPTESSSIFNAVKYANSLWLAIGDCVLMSTNGKTWSKLSNDSFKALAYSNENWLAVGAKSLLATIIATVTQAISYIKSKLGIQ